MVVVLRLPIWIFKKIQIGGNIRKLRTSGKWDRNILKQAKKINGGKLSAISKYGSNTKGKAAGEVVAEAVSEYMKKGKSASSTSKAIVQALKSYV